MDKQTDNPIEQGKPGKRHVVSSVITFVLCAVFAFGAFVFIWYVCDDFSDFDDFSSEIYIECLDDGAKPQSVTVYSPSSGSYSGEKCYIVGANAKTGEAGLYISGETSGYIGYVPLTYCGEPFCGRALVATNGYALWVASGDTVFVTSTGSRSTCGNALIASAANNTAALKAQNEDVEDDEAEPGETESFELLNSFCSYLEADFISAYGTTRLYIGENRSESFKKSDHAVKTSSGDKNTAFVHEYTVETSDKNFGLSYLSGYVNDDGENALVPEIKYMYSVPGNVNGFARTADGALVLSCGASLSSSRLLCYGWSGVSSSSNRKTYSSLFGSTFEYAGLYSVYGERKMTYTASPYVYFVDSANLVKELVVPPLVAGVCSEASANDVHVLFESGYGSNAKLCRRVERNIYGFSPAI